MVLQDSLVVVIGPRRSAKAFEACLWHSERPAGHCSASKVRLQHRLQKWTAERGSQQRLVKQLRNTIGHLGLLLVLVETGLTRTERRLETGGQPVDLQQLSNIEVRL